MVRMSQEMSAKAHASCHAQLVAQLEMIRWRILTLTLGIPSMTLVQLRQILDKIYEVCGEIELGYWSNDQKVKLEGNDQLLMRSLCYVQKHWKVLFRADYPHIPTGAEGFELSKLLSTLVDGLTRNKKNEWLCFYLSHLTSMLISNIFTQGKNLKWEDSYAHQCPLQYKMGGVY